jgi:hypothetical protein
MRVTDSRLDLAASHTLTTSLDAHRQVSAWDRTGRVELTDDVKVTLSGADASAVLHDEAGRFAGHGSHGIGWGAAAGAGLGRGLGHAGLAGHGQALGSGLRPSALLATRLASAVPATTDGTAETDDEPLSALSADQRAWLLLLRMTGDEDAAARLATRLAAIARATSGTGDFAARMDHLVAQYAASGAAAGATGGSGGGTQAPAEDWGYREDVSVKVTEVEATSFHAAATVQTADGRSIDVRAAFDLVRAESTEVGASVRLGAAAHDPLVLAVGGGAPSLGAGTQQVDVDNDGTGDAVAALAPGSAYLVRDLNGNGVVDAGSELFGPATEDGFGELAALDQDGNGWVDEGDAAFTQLSLWTGVQGAALTSLKAAGVGALATDHVSTPYQYGAATGVLTASSIFLYEDGRAGISGELELYA